jgi:hypothetical protein
VSAALSLPVLLIAASEVLLTLHATVSLAVQT